MSERLQWRWQDNIDLLQPPKDEHRLSVLLIFLHLGQVEGSENTTLLQGSSFRRQNEGLQPALKQGGGGMQVRRRLCACLGQIFATRHCLGSGSMASQLKTTGLLSPCVLEQKKERKTDSEPTPHFSISSVWLTHHKELCAIAPLLCANAKYQCCSTGGWSRSFQTTF